MNDIAYVSVNASSATATAAVDVEHRIILKFSVPNSHYTSFQFFFIFVFDTVHDTTHRQKEYVPKAAYNITVRVHIVKSILMNIIIFY